MSLSKGNICLLSTLTTSTPCYCQILRDEVCYECMGNLMHVSLTHPQSGSHFTHTAFVNWNRLQVMFNLECMASALRGKNLKEGKKTEGGEKPDIN